MSRQINPHLFEDPSLRQTAGISAYSAPGLNDMSSDLEGLLQSPEPGPYYGDLLARIEKTKYQVSEWVSSLNLKIEKQTQRFYSIEERLKQAAVENHERLAAVALRIKDRNSSDLKVEALIERHNQIVQSFELRLSQAQRLVENQALQLAKQQELIDEARRQIEKLKKL
jgi:hypothetical protein